MKNKITIILTAVALAFGSTLLVGCGGSGSSTQEATTTEETTGHEAHAEHAHYACPMDCEHGKVYDEPGTCPECNMALKEITEEEAHGAEVEEHADDHEHDYACPMHPEEKGHEGDKCGKCGMDLEKVAE